MWCLVIPREVAFMLMSTRLDYCPLRQTPPCFPRLCDPHIRHFCGLSRSAGVGRALTPARLDVRLEPPFLAASVRRHLATVLCMGHYGLPPGKPEPAHQASPKMPTPTHRPLLSRPTPHFLLRRGGLPTQARRRSDNACSQGDQAISYGHRIR